MKAQPQAFVNCKLLDVWHAGMACGPKGKFKLPIVVQCFSHPDPNTQRAVSRTLFDHGMHLSTSDPRSHTTPSQGVCCEMCMSFCCLCCRLQCPVIATCQHL